jgi:hypothetical protein
LRYKRNRRFPARRQSRAARAAASRRAISSPRAPRKRLCIRARRTRCCLLALPRAPGAPRRSRPSELCSEAYLAELQRLFDANAAACLPPDVAARGLKIVMV